MEMKTCFRLSIAAATLLVGCSTPYKPPASGPTALLRFTGNVASVHIDYGSCDTYKLITKKNWGSADPGKIGGIGTRDSDWGTSPVGAGERIWVEMANGSCRMAASFVPREGMTYQAYLSLDMRNYLCHMEISDVSSGRLQALEAFRKEDPRNTCLAP